MGLLKVAWVLARTWALISVGWLALVVACVNIAGKSHGTPLEMALGILALGTLALGIWSVAAVKGALAGVVHTVRARNVVVGVFGLLQVGLCVCLGFMSLVIFNR